MFDHFSFFLLATFGFVYIYLIIIIIIIISASIMSSAGFNSTKVCAGFLQMFSYSVKLVVD